MSWYRGILVIHILAIISWMAGILYLYRLFINHVESGRTSQAVHQVLVGMEERLYRIITRPAMIVAALTGAAMIALNPALLDGHWLHVKLLAALLLIGATLFAKRLQLRFAAYGAPVPSSRNLRILNEVPTLLMIIIVAMVILRPF